MNEEIKPPQAPIKTSSQLLRYIDWGLLILLIIIVLWAKLSGIYNEQVITVCPEYIKNNLSNFTMSVIK